MSAHTCPHCKKISEDPDYCQYCWKPMKPSTSLERLFISKRWEEDVLSCDTVTLPILIEKKHFPSFINGVEIPLHITHQENESTLFFLKKDGYRSLFQYLMEIDYISMNLGEEILRHVSKIVNNLHDRGYIVGSFDLSDFWVHPEDLSSFTFRISRPLYREGQTNKSSYLEFGEFSAPECKTDEPITYSADVHIIGLLFVALVLNRRQSFSNYSELRYMAHQIQNFLPELPFALHTWLRKSTNLRISERFETVKEQIDQFEKRRNIDYKQRCSFNSQENDDLQSCVKVVVDTNVGEGKKEKGLQRGIKDPLELNQDRYLTLSDPKRQVTLVVIADGISTCKYGSGSLAAQIVCDTAMELWEEYGVMDFSKGAAKIFLKELVEKSNQNVAGQSIQLIPSGKEVFSGELMGSTLTACLIHQNKLYSISVGDSRQYLWSKDDGLQLLHVDQNIRNQELRNNLTWQEVTKIEGASALSHYIGMVKKQTGILVPFKPVYSFKEVHLFGGDVILLCSDGLMDYLISTDYQQDPWKAEEIIDTLLATPLVHEKLCQQLISLANENGGGDNITVALIQYS